MLRVGELLAQRGKFWALLADFNLDPGELASSGWPERLRGRLVTSRSCAATCCPPAGTPGCLT
eukprot:5074168-Lingulodinium_polyedra.AAC.1